MYSWDKRKKFRTAIAMDCYDQARSLAIVTGSVGSTVINEGLDGQSVQATWNRRDEAAPFKHVAKEPR